MVGEEADDSGHLRWQVRKSFQGTLVSLTKQFRWGGGRVNPLGVDIAENWRREASRSSR